MDQVMKIIEQFKNASLEMIQLLLQNPDNETQLVIYGLVSFLACRWAFIRVVHSMNLNDLNFSMYFVTTALGLGAIILSLAAVKLYMPEWLESGDSLFYIIGVVIVSSLVFSVPIIQIFSHDNYFKTSLAWGVSLLAIVGTMMISVVLADAFFQGQEVFDRGTRRNEETQKIIGGK